MIVTAILVCLVLNAVAPPMPTAHMQDGGKANIRVRRVSIYRGDGSIIGANDGNWGSWEHIGKDDESYFNFPFHQSHEKETSKWPM